MKSAYVFCALLGVTIGTLVLADNDTSHMAVTTSKPIVSSASSVAESKIADSGSNTANVTTAIPKPNNIAADVDTSPNISTAAITTSITPTTPTTPITPTTPSNATTPTTPKTTSNIPSTTTPFPKPTTVPTKPTIPTTEASTSPTTPTSTAAAKTTAVPSASPTSKDRQFDGLSFFGGIILTTCLMAIAAFSWKFYRQCKEGNYRTL